jgi:hypothetical protein
MTLRANVETVKLPARTVHRLGNGPGAIVACRAGTVWITQANDPRDIVLVAGESFVLDRNGLALVMALKDAALTIEKGEQSERLAA